MFEFLTRRHAAPAETPLSEVRFTREDLFVLMGGSDTGMFAADDDTIDFGKLEREGMGAWRRDMATRLSSTGLVDAEGVPSDELAGALYPLNKPGIAVNDGPRPQRRGERDRRTVSAVFYDGAATAIRALSGRRAGFGLVPLPSERDWDAVYRSLVSCPQLCNRSSGMLCFAQSDNRIGDSLIKGDAAWLSAHFALPAQESLGMEEFISSVKSSDPSLRKIRWFVVSDYRECNFEMSLGFSIPQMDAPGFTKRTSIVFPDQGVAFSDAWAKPGPSSEPKDFSAVEFLSEGSLLDFLLRPYSYPEALRASEEGASCSSS